MKYKCEHEHEEEADYSQPNSPHGGFTHYEHITVTIKQTIEADSAKSAATVFFEGHSECPYNVKDENGNQFTFDQCETCNKLVELWTNEEGLIGKDGHILCLDCWEKCPKKPTPATEMPQ